MTETRNVRLITKRTSVPGKIPTGTTGNELNYIKSGELASNLADHSLWGFDGTSVFEYGSNSFLGLTGGTLTGGLNLQSLGGGALINNLGIDASGNVVSGITSTSGNLWSASTGANSIIANNGTGNLGSGQFSLVAGQANTSSGFASAIIGGYSNTVTGSSSSIIGGYNNSAYGYFSFVGAGHSNTAFGNDGAIIGGYNNSVSGSSSSVAGGFNNEGSGSFTFIGGGSYNKAVGDFSSIVGGETNNVSSDTSTIAGGSNNQILQDDSFIGGGSYNKADSVQSSVVGGMHNEISDGSDSSVIAGGTQNEISDINSFIGGGYGNSVDRRYSSIIGGFLNQVTGSRSVIIGGQGITGTTDDTVYVPNLNIKNIGAGSPIINLGLDASGNVVTGTTSGSSAGAYLPLSGGTMTGTIDGAVGFLNLNDNISGTNAITLLDVPITAPDSSNGLIVAPGLGTILLSTGNAGIQGDGNVGIQGGGNTTIQSGLDTSIQGEQSVNITCNDGNVTIGPSNHIIIGNGASKIFIDSAVGIGIPNSGFAGGTIGGRNIITNFILDGVISTNTPKGGTIVSSQNSSIDANVTNSVIIGGQGITASTNDTVYVSNLNVKNEDWTIELMDAQVVDFYAPYNLKINSVDTILSATTVTLYDDGVLYSLTNLINSGSKITVSAATQTVINLNIER